MKPAPSNMWVPEVIKANFKSLSSVRQSLQPMSQPSETMEKQVNVNLRSRCPLQMTSPFHHSQFKGEPETQQHRMCS